MQEFFIVIGLLHFCQIPGMMMAPRMLAWKDDLAKLQPINRRIVKVIGVSIMIVVLGMGVVVVAGAGDLAAGGPLAVGVCAFLSVLWCFRATVQVTLYRKIWPGGVLGRLSHYGLSFLFYFQAAAYFFGAGAALLR